jgi:hypothetical protein
MKASGRKQECRVRLCLREDCEVFLTKSAKPLEEIAKGGGWLPDGHGVLTEKITQSADGKSFTSRIRWDMFDVAGKTVESGIEGTGEGRRMGF